MMCGKIILKSMKINYLINSPQINFKFVTKKTVRNLFNILFNGHIVLEHWLFDIKIILKQVITEKL